jgi:diguanylate cyclase (GGDEF)-like protein
MRHFAIAFRGLDELAGFLERQDVAIAANAASAVLAQVFVSTHDKGYIRAIVSLLRSCIPDVVVVGATTAGEIANGHASLDTSAVSLSCFDGARLSALAMPLEQEGQFIAGARIGERIKTSVAELKGVLALATTLSSDCSTLLAGIESIHLGVPVFGGAAADYGEMSASRVFLDDTILDQGAVVVALAGADLHLQLYGYLGWRTFGKSMTVTGVDGLTLKTLDGEPAFSVYQHYLGIEPDEQFFRNVLEFPLVFEREGCLLARIPVASDADGGIRFIADIREGEKVRLGYGDVDVIVEETAATSEKLQAFQPEGIYMYSCACRRFLMQGDVDLELAPFQAIAPTAGFFTLGEICSAEERLFLLNATLVIVGLRERGIDPRREGGGTALPQETKDAFSARHARVLGRLMNFIGVVTGELEEANRSLRELAERDMLTAMYNRRAFMERLDQEIGRGDRFPRPFSIVLFDVDHFKQFNDLYGHAAGDFVLQLIARLLEQQSRDMDVAARIGGEEFALLLPEASLTEALIIAERLRDVLAKTPCIFEGKTLHQITASFGVATFPAFQTMGALLKAADLALYRAKREGRNRVMAATQGS